MLKPVDKTFFDASELSEDEVISEPKPTNQKEKLQIWDLDEIDRNKKALDELYGSFNEACRRKDTQMQRELLNEINHRKESLRDIRS